MPSFSNAFSYSKSEHFLGKRCPHILSQTVRSGAGCYSCLTLLQVGGLFARILSCSPRLYSRSLFGFSCLGTLPITFWCSTLAISPFLVAARHNFFRAYSFWWIFFHWIWLLILFSISEKAFKLREPNQLNQVQRINLSVVFLFSSTARTFPW